ncbi:40S ribosomal protein S27-like protein [Leptotrombidium deliense]|uniref:40S ribosomal protein S27-like protein n=1 Tax=Leptotrombidium deliense TaxID=299467 RepID=A0A443QC11_9ACAR|nr:40S ribosomal protein S27-like protein [Leptotrombidium deliense]
MDMKSPGWAAIISVIGHVQMGALCIVCFTVLCQPSGGKAKLPERHSFREATLKAS